jgi:hypothetical protein
MLAIACFDCRSLPCFRIYISNTSCRTRIKSSSILGKHVEDKAVKFLPNVKEAIPLMQVNIDVKQ